MDPKKDHKLSRRVLIQEPPRNESDGQQEEGERFRPQLSKSIETQEPFMGMKIRRRASMYRQYMGDYINVPSNQQILKLLTKQGDRQVVFADGIVKVNRDGKIKRRILIITDVALYTLDPRWCNLKRRIALSAIDRVHLSEFNDNFFAIIVPSEYDCLLASTRKSEVVTVLVEATKNVSDNPLDVYFSNRFVYNVDCENSREVLFEEVEGGVKTKIVKK